MTVTASTLAAPTHEVFVTNELSGDLTIIDGDRLQVVATIPLGKRPRGIEATRDGRRLYIALSGSPIEGPPDARNDAGGSAGQPVADKSADGIGEFDVRSRKLTRVIHGVSDPEKLAVTPDGRQLYVASEDSGSVVIIDVESGQQKAAIAVGTEPEGVRASPDGSTVYVTAEGARQVTIVDTRTHKVLKQLQVGERPRSIAFTPDGTTAYVPGELDGTITEINARNLGIRRTIQIEAKSARLMDAVVAPDGCCLYLSTGRGRTVMALDTRNGKALGSATVGARPWGLALSPDGKRIYAANGPSNDVSVINTGSFQVIATIPAGKGPWGVAVVSR